MSTAIGATQRAASRPPARAVALACTLTELIPKSLEKMPGAWRCTLTVTVSFGTFAVENVIWRPAPATFLSRYSDASALACAEVVGQRLRGRERGGVGVRLRVALLAEPGADVEHHRDGAEERGQEHDGDDRGLATIVADALHSTRSVVLDSRSPAATTNPSRLTL